MPSTPFLLLATLAGGLIAADDIIIADFEGPGYGAWTTTGEAFGDGPAHGAIGGQMHVDGFMGKGLVNSFNKGDGSTGTLTSPAFTIERPFIGFLIGGGRDPDRLCLSLLIDGKTVRSATGPNDKPGGSEELACDAWDVKEFIGKTAVIRIVDQATGGWGHITVDHIVQSGRKPAALVNDATRDIAITKRYLHLPIANKAKTRKVAFLVDGTVMVRNDIGLADGQPDWWAFMDVSAWNGKTLTLRVDKLPADSMALSTIEQSDIPKDADNLYQEPLRGQFHFSSRRGWLNDPNGLSFFHGEYHLFYQHNPYGWNWGNMHWGHAVSRDLLHWQELGDTLAPDTAGPMFSGSAVVDRSNTSGLGTDGKPPHVLIYTAAGNPTVQCLAYGTDGRTYTKFSGNPVLAQITGGNRDPKVFWHEPTKKWVMVLYVGKDKQHTVHFLTSPNLREWTLASICAGGGEKDAFLFECPDFFPLAVDGDARNIKWVLTAADSAYAIGTFDGTTFTPEQTRLTGHRGRGVYAAQTFSDIPAQDGRRIQIGWFHTATPGMPFNQSMTIPLELGLITTPDGPRLTMNPVQELATLRTGTTRFDTVQLRPDSANPLAGINAELVEVDATITPGDAEELVFTVRGAAIAYDLRKQELIVNKLHVPAPLRGGRQRLRIFCDRTALEVVASDGLTYVPMPFQPKADDRGLGVQVTGGGATINALQVHHLGSIWK